MKIVEHIVWNDKVYGDIGEKIYGICELEIFYHGGGSEKIICEGVYIFEGLGLLRAHYGLISSLGLKSVKLRLV